MFSQHKLMHRTLTKLRRYVGLSPVKSDVRRARLWSNSEPRKFAHLYTGQIVNVSAWRDEDKEGGHYAEYFCNAKEYSTTNFAGWRGAEQLQIGRSLALDLEEPLPLDLVHAYDVVFNHTTLEHIFHLQQAFDNLCNMSRDTVIVVVPFKQHLHGPDDGDFWRFSPFCLRRLFQTRGLEVVYESASPGKVIYLFYIASRVPEKWFPHYSAYGRSLDLSRLRLPD